MQAVSLFLRIPSSSTFSEAMLHLLGLFSHNFSLSFSTGPSTSLSLTCAFPLKKPCVGSSSPPILLPLCFTSCFPLGQTSQELHFLLCFLMYCSFCSPFYLLVCWVALDRVTSDIHVAKNNNKKSGEHFSLSIFLDLSAAFDIFVKTILPFSPVTRLF